MKKKILVIVSSVLVLGVVALLGVLLNNKYQSNKAVTAPDDSPKFTATVRITEDGFSPSTLKVQKGTLVSWVNGDVSAHRVAANPYPVEANALFDSKVNLSTNGVYTYLFNEPGVYQYHDEVSPQTIGEIVVE